MEDIFVSGHKAIVESKKAFESISREPMSFLDVLSDVKPNLVPRDLMAQLAHQIGDIAERSKEFEGFYVTIGSSVPDYHLVLVIGDKELGVEMGAFDLTAKEFKYIQLPHMPEPSKTLSPQQQSRIGEIRAEAQKLAPTKFQAFLEGLFAVKSHRDIVLECLDAEVDTLARQESERIKNWQAWKECDDVVSAANKRVADQIIPLCKAHGYSIHQDTL